MIEPIQALGDKAFRVLVIIATHCPDGRSCAMDDQRIGSIAGGCSEGSVQRALVELEEAHLIRRERRYGRRRLILTVNLEDLYDPVTVPE